MTTTKILFDRQDLTRFFFTITNLHDEEMKTSIQTVI